GRGHRCARSHPGGGGEETAGEAGFRATLPNSWPGDPGRPARRGKTWCQAQDPPATCRKTGRIERPPRWVYRTRGRTPCRPRPAAENSPKSPHYTVAIAVEGNRPGIVTKAVGPPFHRHLADASGPPRTKELRLGYNGHIRFPGATTVRS